MLRAMQTPSPAAPPKRPLDLAGALPDALTAGFFLLLWIVPGWLGTDALRTGLLMMLVEFILVHAAGILGQIALGADIGRKRWRAVLGFSLLYLLFIGAWAFVFEAWWPLLALLWLVAGKVHLALQPIAGEEKLERMKSEWAMSAIFYLGGVFATVMLPIPRLGLGPSVVAAANLPGSGLWVDKPHTVVAFGLVYFGLLAVAKARRWRLPDGRGQAAR